jgi:hypothetical protein
LVPIEDWISTVSYLIAKYSDHLKDYEADLLPLFHSTIHSICLTCTSPSHVRSLVDEGILRYWEVLGSNREAPEAAGSLEAISHLTWIDPELSSRIGQSGLLA